MQAKGGCGKTVVASLLAQGLRESGREIAAFDCDSLNGSLSSIPGLHAQRVPVLDDENETNVDALNACISGIIAGDKDAVLDTGASSFVPVATYLAHAGLIDLLVQSGRRVVVHVPLVGGEAMEETAHGLVYLIGMLPQPVEFVVWKNEFFGLVAADGRQVDESALFDHCRARIRHTITVRALNPRFEGAAFRKMLMARLTFDEALAPSSPFDLISRMWLEVVWNGIRKQIAGVV